MKLPVLIAAIVGILVVGYGIFEWEVNRYDVPVGKSLQVRYKGPLIGSGTPAKPGRWAEDGEVGVRRELRGPGRHFVCPIWYERTLIDDVEIAPGEVGIVTCKIGDPLPEGQYLVDGEIGTTTQQGVLRKCLAPGRYRVNPYGYEVKKVVKSEPAAGEAGSRVSGWVDIPAGYVGVVTNLADNPLMKENAGVQDQVLPAGIYLVNGRQQQVDVVEIGYRETTVEIVQQRDETGNVVRDKSGEPLIASTSGGIGFPSADGFPITMDFTTVWGLFPEQAANAVRVFGNIDQIEQKVILPQIESICRNNGSEYPAVDLLVGEEREVFQNDVLAEFQKVLDAKQIHLLYGLVRHLYIPTEVRLPIQTSFVADELKLTRQQEQETARAEADLREAEKLVDLETAKVAAETGKLVAGRQAEGQKIVGETAAETRKLVAAIERQTADLESEAKLALGQAESEGKKLVAEAESGKFKLAVEAFGSSDAYTRWVFASNLPSKIELQLLYAGPGTLWTDLKDAVRVVTEPTQPTGPAPKTAVQKAAAR